MSTNGPEAADPRFPAGVLLSLVAALVVSVLALRTLTDGGSASGGAVRERQERGTALPVAAAIASPTAPARPVRSLPLPERTMFASVQEAGRRLGLPVRDPRVLPQGLFPLSVAWQPEGPAVAPRRPPPGRLLAYYYSLRDGVSLTLEQGQGVGVATEKAPAGAHGTVTLPDGTSLVWVRGHLNLTVGPLGLVEEWLGDELMVGVPASAGVGWRLISSIYSLDDLVQVAEGLR